MELPSSIIKIGFGAFEYCTGLTSIELPPYITEISEEMFNGCNALTSVKVPVNVTEIGRFAFNGCKALTGFVFPPNITKIDDSAFSDCLSLTSLTLPASVDTIGDHAFSGCRGLTSFYVCREEPLEMSKYVFANIDKLKFILYVPRGTRERYFNTTGWGTCGMGYIENIVEYDPTGIDKVTTSTDAKELSRYSVNGQRLVGPTKGLNIVKYSDGSVKKVAVQ